MGVCYDIEGNSVDCGDSSSVGYSGGSNASDAGAGLDLTSNPIAAQASSSNGGSSIWGSVLNFGSSIATPIVKSLTQPTASSNLRLQINPTTGQQQYYNPSTGQYVGGPVTTSTSLLGGNSWIFVVFALALAFFAFGGKKALARA